LEPTPERTAFARLRPALAERELDKALFDAIIAQLKAKSIRVKTGTLVDATIIASASEGDGEAHRVKHNDKPAVHGFMAHVRRILAQFWILPVTPESLAAQNVLCPKTLTSMWKMSAPALGTGNKAVKISAF